MEKFSTSSRLYLFLGTLFVTTLLVADMSAGKFFLIGTLEVSVGVIPFPLAFLVTDIVNEYYGRRGAQLLTRVGMLMLAVAFVLLTTMRVLPIAPHSPVPQEAFNAVFGVSFRFFAASMIAYLVGQITDIYTFHFYKKLTRSRHLWLRATGSTAVSQVVDTTIVNGAALAGVLSWAEIWRVCVWSYAYKMVVAIALTPLVYAAHRWITGTLGIQPAPHDDAHDPLSDLPFAGP